MRATTKMEVKKDTRVIVTLEMSVDEMEGLLVAIDRIDGWPTYAMKEIFRQSLGKVKQAYSSDHVIEP